jgi:hypothetical protein
LFSALFLQILRFMLRLMPCFLQYSAVFAALSGVISPLMSKPLNPDATLQTLVDGTAQNALQRFKPKGLKAENLAITLIDLRDANFKNGSYHGNQPIYPASVVKLFYLAHAHRQLEDGILKDSPELQRGLKDMIVESTNDATGYILDCITQTTSGPELSSDELKLWGEKRNAVNRFFKGLDYEKLNINQKTWNEGPYGRERQFLGPNYENRNKLTTDGTARLLAEIASGQFVSAERSRQMMELLKRDVKNKSDSQSVDFSGLALKEVAGVKLWSKAGWTSTARHDAAYIETPDGKRFVMVVFTTGVANEKEIIPFVVKEVLEGLK